MNKVMAELARLREELAHPRLTLQEWVVDEAQRDHVSVDAIYSRIARNHYPNLKIQRQGKQRVAYIVSQ